MCKIEQNKYVKERSELWKVAYLFGWKRFETILKKHYQDTLTDNAIEKMVADELIVSFWVNNSETVLAASVTERMEKNWGRFKSVAPIDCLKKYGLEAMVECLEKTAYILPAPKPARDSKGRFLPRTSA